MTTFFKCYRCGHMEASPDPEKYVGKPCKGCKSGKMETWRDADQGGLTVNMPRIMDTVDKDREKKPIKRQRGKRERKRR